VIASDNSVQFVWPL